MDDLLFFTPSTKAHVSKLENLPKALLKNGLKISPKKYQLFKTELQYMGNLITVPIYQSKAEEIGDTLIEHFVMKYCVPDCIIMDQDSAFILSLMNDLFNRLDTK